MSIQESRKQSDLEKRLKLIRQQVYGKENKQFLAFNYQSPDKPNHSDSFRTDITYLNQDLLKIFIFSALALGIQITLFILSKNYILNLNFF